jgi:hypothetical protein
MPGYQSPSESCAAEKGPIPEGSYNVLLKKLGQAKDDGKGNCNLKSGFGIETIPRGSAAGACEEYWVLWGNNRVRLEPADASTRRACSPSRDGFYIHDSSKGFTHGCIEVEPSFFTRLRSVANLGSKKHLTLNVKYVKNRSTYGGTLN